MAIDLVKKGETVLLEGLNKALFPMSILKFVSKEIYLKGCIGHDKNDILQSIKFFAEKKVNANHYISKIITLKDIQDTFKMILTTKERKFIKIIAKIS